MKKKTLAWCVKTPNGEIFPMWINSSKRTLQKDIGVHRRCGQVGAGGLKIIRVEIKEIKGKRK